jgi:SAM-dependent methyltransferase
VSWRQFLFARLMARASRHHEPLVGPYKRRLFERLSGRVLEIGPGSGQNFAYYPAGIEWTGYEPNPYLARQIEHGNVIAEPFAEGDRNFYDFAVSTLVLCSVGNPHAVLQALHRALKPGGALLYLEHVAAAPETKLYRAQHRWQPLWRCLADGCHPTRDTSQAIKAAGFAIEEEERFELPLWLASPHICGIARKQS